MSPVSPSQSGLARSEAERCLNLGNVIWPKNQRIRSGSRWPNAVAITRIPSAKFPSGSRFFFFFCFVGRLFSSCSVESHTHMSRIFMAQLQDQLVPPGLLHEARHYGSTSRKAVPVNIGRLTGKLKLRYLPTTAEPTTPLPFICVIICPLASAASRDVILKTMRTRDASA